MSTRERKYRYIHSFGQHAGADAVRVLYARYGLDMLSDAQLAEVVSDLTQQWRFQQRMNRRNRLRAKTGGV
ncbi:MAG TPA: hypothetical protein DCY10_04045 [Clostridiales bacterium]|jgi:hypothetical protein|nr:hypothetical protein [Clostridiales bacterium]